MSWLIALYRGIVCYTLMLFLGSLVALLRFVSAGALTRFNAEVLAPIVCRVILLLIGIKVENRLGEQRQGNQAVKLFNHNSYLDIFIVPMLGLKNTRFIISSRTKKILPLYLCNLGIGSIFIPFKDQPEQREAFFARVSQEMKKEGFSVICAPEGVHRFRHGIANFNKGVFYMAQSAGLPLEGIFFSIPEKCNPLETHKFKAGTVKVERLDLWTLPENGELAGNINQIRDKFVMKFNKEFGGKLA